METYVSSEQDFNEFKGKFPEGSIMIHFKMVGIGSNGLAKAEYLGPKICQLVREQPGFFVVSHNGSTVDLREVMHGLVDQFCNAQEGQ